MSKLYSNSKISKVNDKKKKYGFFRRMIYSDHPWFEASMYVISVIMLASTLAFMSIVGLCIYKGKVDAMTPEDMAIEQEYTTDDANDGF